MFFALVDIPEEEARYWAKKLEQLNAMRDQDDVSQGIARPRVRAIRELLHCQQAALTGLSLPSMPSRRSRKSLCLFTAPSAVSAALFLLLLWDPLIALSLQLPTSWGPCLPLCTGPQPKWGSTSPHILSQALLPSSLLCLLLFAVSLPCSV